MTPHVPTSSRLRGLYMSTMLRVKSSAFAPSLTSMASGFALTMSRTTLSALWIVHRRRVLRQRFRHLRDVLGLALRDGVEPLGGRLRPRSGTCVDRAEHGRDARADVADDRRIDADVAVRLLRRDVDLDELLAAPLPWRCCRPTSCLCRAKAASSAAHRSPSRRRLPAARTSAPRTRIARACRAAGPWPSPWAGRGCRSFPPARECPHRPARTPRPCRE